MILWQLRYRSPLSPTRGVDDVVIQTEHDDEAEAKDVADWWLAHKVPSPSTRFVYVRRLVVATTADVRRAQAPGRPAVPLADTSGPSPAQAASQSTAPTPTFAPPAVPTDGGAGAADAELDAMAAGRPKGRSAGRVGA